MDSFFKWFLRVNLMWCKNFKYLKIINNIMHKFKQSPRKWLAPQIRHRTIVFKGSRLMLTHAILLVDDQETAIERRSFSSPCWKLNYIATAVIPLWSSCIWSMENFTDSTRIGKNTKRVICASYSHHIPTTVEEAHIWWLPAIKDFIVHTTDEIHRFA